MAGRILIVDAVATNRIVLKVKLSAACYETSFALEAATCLAEARTRTPDLILLASTLPDLDGGDLLRQLRGDPATRDIPVVIILPQADTEATLTALRAGADDVLARPLDDQVLLARLRGLLRAREGAQELAFGDAAREAVGFAEASEGFATQGAIALVMERPETALRWRKDLAAHLSDRVVAMARDDALAEAAAGCSRAPDVYVIEAEPGAGSAGLRLLSDLRSRAGSRRSAICMVLPETSGPAAAIAFDLGADDLVSASVDPREMALRLRRLLVHKRRTDRMRATIEDGLRLAVIDPLTGLHNRRYALAQVGRIADAARVSPEGYAVLAIDLDRFKKVNDIWGHAAGDAVLVEVARRLSAGLRSTDLLARMGGEEFLVVLPDTGLAEARQIAERLCRSVESPPIALPACGTLAVTVSIGLAVAGGLPDRGDGAAPVSAIIDRADRALLTAKAGGRNQVTICRTAA